MATDQTATALVLCFDLWKDTTDPREMMLPGPWYVPDPTGAKACANILDIPAAATTDDTARQFICDRATERTLS